MNKESDDYRLLSMYIKRKFRCDERNQVMQSLHRCRGLELQRFHEERIQFSTCAEYDGKEKEDRTGNPTRSVRKQRRFGGKTHVVGSK